jgi:SAM-dependent methyltransferase
MNRPKLYHDWAKDWPVLSPPSDYKPEAAMVRGVLHEYFGDRRLRVLELGAGGGHTLVHLADEHECFACDLSSEMLSLCETLIPGGIRTVQADMRTLALNEKFDAVLLHDAADYLLNGDDLRATFTTARKHLKDDGIILVAPTYTTETFIDGEYACDQHHDEANRRELTLLSHAHRLTHEPDAFELLLVLLERDLRSGEVRVSQDRHRCGLFSRETWADLLGEAGFATHWLEVHNDEGEEAGDASEWVGLPEGGWAVLAGRNQDSGDRRQESGIRHHSPTDSQLLSFDL